MVKKIIKDVFIFKKAETADKDDIGTALDLADTLYANSDICVGMAANMIGVNKRIIAVSIFDNVMIMINPIITKKYGGSYETEEGCLSLDGKRKTTRYNTIDVEYFDMTFKKHKQTFSGFTAQIIQHEVDHCDGIMI